MKLKRKVLVAGRSKEAVTELESCLSSCDYLDVQLRHIVNGHADPLYGIDEEPDLMVLHINGVEGGELEALIERPASRRPPMIVVSDTGDAAVMRTAMKAGARDFLPQVDGVEVLSSVDNIFVELAEEQNESGRLIAVINAKGGSGATFLACNLAHLAARVTGESTALMSLDMQFPTLPSYFDMKPRHGILQALESAEHLDAVALDAIMESHHSGLKVLAARPDDFRFNSEPIAGSAESLLDLLQGHYQNIVVDVPRRLDSVSAQVLSRASRVVLVVQQSLPHVQDAARMQQLLHEELGLPGESIVAVVNRYTKSAEIELGDIQKALPESDLVTIPNNFREVSESINVGVPMYEHARQSAVTRALIALQARLFEIAPGDHPALSTGRLSALLQKTPLQRFFGGA